MFITAKIKLQKSRHSVKKVQNEVIMTFKAVQGHRCQYQSKAHMRLLISE